MGLLRKLFGRKREAVDVGRLDLNKLQLTINEYGAIIERQSKTGSVVYDESALPLPKEDLRKALLMLIASIKDTQSRDQLKAGYLMLADFQVGVGSRTIAIDPQADAATVAKQAVGESTPASPAERAAPSRARVSLCSASARRLTHPSTSAKRASGCFRISASSSASVAILR